MADSAVVQRARELLHSRGAESRWSVHEAVITPGNVVDWIRGFGEDFSDGRTDVCVVGRLTPALMACVTPLQRHGAAVIVLQRHAIGPRTLELVFEFFDAAHAEERLSVQDAFS